MKDSFFAFCERLQRELGSGEVLLCTLSGERSDFVRFNHGKVRQAGSVQQAYVTARLIAGGRQASITTTLETRDGVVSQLRDTLSGLPEDPWLLISETPRSTESVRRGRVPAAEQVTSEVVDAAASRDLVGISAGGTLYRGFANSLGQRNWHEIDSFNFDFSIYLRDDKAVKLGYAGFDWDGGVLRERIETGAAPLGLLDRPVRRLEPGEYRAYLAPRALEELAGMLCWGGFSARARATKQSPLLRMQEGAALSPKVSLVENIAGGVAPGFQGDGFVKPPRVVLVQEGKLADALVSPRSAKEYGLATNAASGRESPDSLELAGGTLDAANALEALERGLLISNLWYLNFSDRPAGRITGMTRFATFWVERGRIVAPVTPMRFDDSVYRMLGENLLDLSREPELLLDPSTYGERSTSSARLPGALLSALRFTL